MVESAERTEAHTELTQFDKVHDVEYGSDKRTISFGAKDVHCFTVSGTLRLSSWMIHSLNRSKVVVVLLVVGSYHLLKWQRIN